MNLLTGVNKTDLDTITLAFDAIIEASEIDRDEDTVTVRMNQTIWNVLMFRLKAEDLIGGDDGTI